MAPLSPFNPNLMPMSKAQFDEEIADEAYFSGNEEILNFEEAECWRTHKVDLIAFEKEIKGKPIFTRKRLERFAVLRDMARNGEEYPLTARDIHGKLRVIWKPADKEEFGGKETTVSLKYLTFVELSSQYDPPDEERSDNVQLLAKYNKWEEEYIPQPVFLSNVPKFSSSCHLRPQDMKRWNDRLRYIKQLWTASSSASLLRQKFKKAAKRSVHIKKIVCVGLGNLRHSNEEEYQAALQHMTAFTIASTLNKTYKEDDASAPPVEIICQDPCYLERDRVLWKQGYKNISFVDDPNGLLTIDANTLVITAFLPTDVPLLQIITDLVPGGPAGVICDRIDLTAEKEMFCIIDRASPRVREMLAGFERSGFEDYVVEREVWDHVCGHEQYWLWAMECFLKPKEGVVEQEPRN